MADYRFIDRDGREKKLDAGALLRRLSRGRISLETPVRRVDQAKFQPLKKDPDLGPASGVIECENWMAARRVSLMSETCFFLLGVILAVFMLLFGSDWKCLAFSAVWIFPAILIGAQFRKRWPRLPSRRELRQAWLLLLPYLNLLTGPAVGFAMFRRRRFAFTVAWAAYSLLVVMLWLLPGTLEARFYPAILLLFAYGAAFWMQISVARMSRLRLAAIRKSAGFGEVPPWYRPLPRRSSPLLPFWRRRGKAEMRLFVWSSLVCFLSLAVYAGVLWGVGMIQLGEVEREVRGRGLPVTDAECVSELDHEAAALFDSIELPEFPAEFCLRFMEYPDLYGERDAVYRCEVQRYFETNREKFQPLRGVWALGVITLPDAESELVQERRRKIKILLKLFEPGLRQEYSSADLARVLRFLYRLEALDEGYLCAGMSENLLAKCATDLSLETLYAEADFWKLREELLQRRVLDLYWRIHLAILDPCEQSLEGCMFFYRPIFRAERLRRMLAEIPRAVWEFGDGSASRHAFAKSNLFDPATFPINSVRINRSFREALARCRVARVGIAAEIFRREHGAFPEKLEELVPDCFPAVPKDPFTGEELRYLRGRLEHAAADIRFRNGKFEEQLREGFAEGIRVYSVGADGVDDGGRNWSFGRTIDISFTIIGK